VRSLQWESSLAFGWTSPVEPYCNRARFGAVLLSRNIELARCSLLDGDGRTSYAVKMIWHSAPLGLPWTSTQLKAQEAFDDRAEPWCGSAGEFRELSSTAPKRVRFQ
jgi:hypothetical protein